MVLRRSSALIVRLEEPILSLHSGHKTNKGLLYVESATGIKHEKNFILFAGYACAWLQRTI